jgi:holo-[acyl-carrier protein] synthase
VLTAEHPDGAAWCECGIDVVELARFRASYERWGERLLARVFTEREAARARGRPDELAARFAAKEAISKALGTGIRGVGWREMEVLSNARGKPYVRLHGAAAARAAALGLNSWSVSLTHSDTVAIAMVVACRTGAMSNEQ